MNTNYNMQAELGVDDMDIVKEFNLDPDIAYTPKINEVMIEKIYQDNIDAYVEARLREDKSPKDSEQLAKINKAAKAEANGLRNQARESLKKLYKKRGQNV